MMNTVNWLMPLLLLPGVGLLLLSTSARFGQLHAEVHQLFEDAALGSMPTIRHLLIRARLFRYALTGLYASAAFLAVSSLFGALADLIYPAATTWLVLFLATAGIVCLLVATVLLVRESTLSLVIIESHVAELVQRRMQHESSPQV